MTRYTNKKGDSGISQYEIGKDYIAIMFKGSHLVYLYKSTKVGRHHVERMKALAAMGKGLSTYISQHPAVRDGYMLG